MKKIAHLILALIRRRKDNARYQCNLKFRVVFVSPFFELEVDAGNGWHTVHSQDGEPISDDDHTLMYPILRFKSFQEAVDYATETLGLVHMKPKMLGLYTAPPASYEKDVQPRLIHPHYFVEGKAVKQPPAQERPHKVPAFKVYDGDKQKAA
jgi:hypothetical protein